MASVQDIYRESVQPLSAADRRRLAELIAEELAKEENAAGERVHLADFIETLPPGPRCFPNWDEYERALQAERDAWDS